MSSPAKPPVIIAVDFDGTCVTHAYPEVGAEIGAPPVLKKLVANGAKLILWTMRSKGRTDGSDPLQDAIDWFKMHEIELHGVNENPGQKSWTQSPKAYAQLYIDDAALGAPLKTDAALSERPFVDWSKVEEMLFPN